jgi:uncharacterized protein YcfJ
MNTRLLGVVATTGLGLFSGLAHADHDRYDRYERRRDEGSDYARVLDVTPLVERVRRVDPVEVCWDEERSVSRNDRTGATLAGGLLGAVVGHQFGSGNGRRAATVAGAVIGGAIANDSAARREARARDDYGYDNGGYDNGDGDRVRHEQRCGVQGDVRFEERVRGYRVTYRYHGRDYVTEMPYDPGPRLRVAVEARPL